MIPRPEGYREPTDDDIKCLPKGTLFMGDNWISSKRIGLNSSLDKSNYAVPINPIPAEDSTDPKGDAGKDKCPLSEQVGGSHYKDFKIQPAEFITANSIGFLEGCVIKRMCRHGSKNKAEDIRKAIHELKLILKLTYNENE